MGRPKLQEKRDIAVKVRLTKKEKEFLLEKAEQEGLNLSAYIRFKTGLFYEFPPDYSLHPDSIISDKILTSPDDFYDWKSCMPYHLKGEKE